MFSSNTSQQSEGYQIQRSLRFNSADSAYLNRTPASAGSRRTWTWSAWVKLSAVGSGWALFSAGTGSQERTYLYYMGVLQFRTVSAAAGIAYVIESTAVYRDPSAWYHIVISFDTASATSSERMKLWVNGAQVTALSTATYPTQNFDAYVNASTLHTMGKFSNADIDYGNGYMTEVNFIDGQALTPSSFGITNPDTGVWQPKAYSGTYGTNGFYLNFSDNSNTTATTLGKDYSGNGNNWTPNNFSVSAGAGNDSLVDVPTPWGTDTGVGGTVRGNYCTLNPLDNGGITLANGNLDASRTTGSWTGLRAGFGISQGKWYWEFTTTSNVDSVNGPMLGLMTSNASISNYPGSDANGYGYLAVSGDKFNSGSGSAYGAGWGNGNVIGIAFDADAGTLTFYKNGASQGTAFTGLTSGPYFPALGLYGATLASGSINFGQRPFAYTAPSGFKALCTQNLPTPTVGATASTQADDYFNAVLYTGDRTDRTITVGFQPDFVWVKPRNNADSHYLMNSLSGTGKYLMSNSTAAEATNAATLTAFTSDGFSVGNTGTTNETGRTYVAWNWKANGAGVTNTAGSITSTVSANTTSGFSVVTFTSPSSAGTVGHGLGVTPKMMIVKSRSNTDDWYVYHQDLGNTKCLLLDTTNGQLTSTAWNNTSPTSSVFTFLGSFNWTYVAYCFAEVPGYSKFGSYTGNGSADGPFVYCGFRPAYVMIKSSTLGDGTANWVIKDKLRAAAYNPQDGNLYANLSGAEDTTSTVYIDFLSNGFKIRGNYAGINAVHTYIFAAFAEAPQKFALAR